MKYKRNWAFEQRVDVFFIDGTQSNCLCQTNNKGQIAFLQINDKQYTPEEFGLLGITNVHFMVPASLEVEVPDDVLGKVYLKLGETISEGDTMKKVEIRSEIEKKLRKRNINIHDLLAALSA